ncbi:sulfite exporter TauE/SafE family protein [Candidatus Bathyarchaeota archaeon]|nr:sulfite exporter TauE/SafE family protein [Candidatus Bathyarchaeota archaeon]
MDPSILACLIICIFLVAILYSCVGHGGASGYIATMTLLGLTPMVIKPTALMLNILVSAIASIQFYRAGYFHWSVFWRFALTSIPFAYIGGYYVLPAYTYKYIIVFILWFSAIQLFVRPVIKTNERRLPSTLFTLLMGAVLGLLSGLMGVGGGIFLSPLLILMGWAGNKETAAVSAFFILVNSCSGLLGFVSADHTIPSYALTFALAAVSGGLVGSYLGSRQLPVLGVQRLLSFILVLAGYKVLFV